MILSTFPNARTAQATRIECDWPTLCQALSEWRESRTKDGPAWSPAVFAGDKRAALNVETLACLVFDLDDSPPDWEGLDGLSAHAHTTHSGGWRLVIETSRPFTAHEHTRLWPAVRAEYAPDSDPACSDASRLFYLPAHKPAESHEARTLEGEPIDVDAWLELFPLVSSSLPHQAQPPASGPVTIPPTPSSNPKNFSMAGLRAQVEALSRPDTRLPTLAFIEGRLELERGERNVTLHRVAGALAYLQVPPPRDVVEGLARVVAQGLEPDEDWVAMVLSSFDRALLRKAADDARATAVSRAFGGSLDTGPTRPARASAPMPSAATASDGDGWMRDLHWKRNEAGEPTHLENVPANLRRIMESDPAMQGIRFNVLKQSIEDISGPLKGCPAETYDVELQTWLFERYQMKLPRTEVAAHLLNKALQKTYNPVAVWLEGLEWDGQARIDELLTTHCQAVGNERHLRRISRKFLIAAVARALRPGCQVDTALILYGPQGCGKSSLVRLLGGQWCSEGRVDFGSKDAYQLAASAWFLELSELAAFKRTDWETIKGFLTTTVDRVRLPYARTVSELPRHCVFVGTTNEPHVLSDHTGNRRWWPVNVVSVDRAWVMANRDQLFAEAVAAFKAGESWWLSGEEAVISEEEAMVFTLDNGMEGQISQWICSHPPDRRPRKVTIEAVGQQCFSFTKSELTTSVRWQLSRALATLGFTRERIRIGQSQKFVYTTPQNLLDTAVVEHEGKLLVSVDGTGPKAVTP